MLEDIRPASETHSDVGVLSMWECGDNFENEIPRGNTETFGSKPDIAIHAGNPWMTLLNACLEGDRKRCDSWNEQTSSLIHTDTVSPHIVTPFLTASFLFVLVAFIDNQKLFPLSNSPQAMDFKILWPVSLVLALDTVLFGVIARQWTDEYRQYYGLEPREALSVYEMRSKGVTKWRFSWIFSILHNIFFGALFSFYVGLIEVLLASNSIATTPAAANNGVITPATIFVYSTIAFFLITTLLPSLQIFFLQGFSSTIKTEDDIPTPCPYKSPQSWFVYNLLNPAFRGFRECKKIFSHFWSLWKKARWGVNAEESGAVRNSPSDTRHGNISLSDVPLYLALHSAPKNWATYDVKWLRIRDMYAQKVNGTLFAGDQKYSPTFMEHSRRPTYDEANILIKTITGSPAPIILFAAYHCFDEVSKDVLFNEIAPAEDELEPRAQERNNILRSYYWKHITNDCIGPPISIQLSDLSNDQLFCLLHDENMLVFLSMHSPRNLPVEMSYIVSARLTELQSRILARVYTSGSRIYESPRIIGPLPLQWLDMMLIQYIDMMNSPPKSPKFRIWPQFGSGRLNSNGVPLRHETIQQLIKQFSIILYCFVEQVKKGANLRWAGTVYSHSSVSMFLSVVSIMLRYTTSPHRHFDTANLFAPSFNVITNTLKASLAAPENDGNSAHQQREVENYLFLCACRIVSEYFNPFITLNRNTPQPPIAQTSDEIKALVKTLSEYEQAVQIKQVQQDARNLWSATGLRHDPTFKLEKEGQIRGSYIPWSSIVCDLKCDS